MKLFAEIRHRKGQGYSLAIGDERILKDKNKPHDDKFFVSSRFFATIQELQKYCQGALIDDQYYVEKRTLSANAKYYRELYYEAKAQLKLTRQELDAAKDRVVQEIKDLRDGVPEHYEDDHYDFARDLTEDLGTVPH